MKHSSKSEMSSVTLLVKSAHPSRQAASSLFTKELNWNQCTWLQRAYTQFYVILRYVHPLCLLSAADPTRTPTSEQESQRNAAAVPVWTDSHYTNEKKVRVAKTLEMTELHKPTPVCTVERWQNTQRRCEGSLLAWFGPICHSVVRNKTIF